MGIKYWCFLLLCGVSFMSCLTESQKTSGGDNSKGPTPSTSGSMPSTGRHGVSYKGNEQAMPIPKVIMDLGQGTMTYKYPARLDLFVSDTKNAHGENQKIPAHTKNNTVLRLASYNVHFWTDPKTSVDTIDPIIKVIKAINADVLMLQEVNWGENPGSVSLSTLVRHKTFKELKNELTAMGYLVDDAAFYRSADHRGAPFGNLILSKYPIAGDGRGQRAYSISALANEKRGIARLTIPVPGGKQLVVITTHLEVNDAAGGDASSIIRAKQLTDLLNYVNEPARKADKNIIIAGDMNQVRKQEFSYQVNHQNAWELFERAQRGGVTWDVLNPLTDSGFIDSFSKRGWQPPKFTTWNGSTIDFVFLKAGFEFEVLGSYVYFDAASDHLPIIVDLGL